MSTVGLALAALLALWVIACLFVDRYR